jgi:hypothetical protein
MTESANAARKGKAVEHLIAASCIIASGSRLNALTALVDDEGIDITFKRRDGFRTLDVQVKSAFLESRKNLREKAIFIADTRRATFRPRDDLFMLFVVVDGKHAQFGPLWFVPSEALDEDGFDIKSEGNRLLRFQASAKKASKDKWRHFRLSRQELAPRILATLGDLETK